MNKYKAIDLFAGIGGIRMGFDQAFGVSIETVLLSNSMNQPVKHIGQTLTIRLKLLAI